MSSIFCEGLDGECFSGLCDGCEYSSTRKKLPKESEDMILYKLSYRIALIANPDCLIISSDDPIEYEYLYGDLILSARNPEHAADIFREFITNHDQDGYEVYQVDMIDAEPLRKETTK